MLSSRQSESDGNRSGMEKDLKIYADHVESQALSQISRLMAQPAFAEAKVRIMPDVHAGAGCVIGFTADLGEKVIPNVVGVDIGCGMLTVGLGRQKPDLAALDDLIHRRIPGGMATHDAPVDSFPELDALHCLPQLRHIHRLQCSLGTLGGGNHFVEVDVDSKGGYYLVIHSGSRNLGKQVCEIYQREAMERHAAMQEDKECRAKSLVRELKQQGRHREISDAVKALHASYPSSVPPELSYLEGEARLRYLDDMRICQHFALRNREVMARLLVESLGLEVQEMFHTTHNYIDHDSNIVRKGAISARKGERLLIPINMRDGCIYGTGKGNDDWNQSAPHGAGRIMSRSQALQTLSVEEFARQMEGVYTTTANVQTLDEAPMAYKGMDAILSHIEPSVDVADIFKPVYNFKAAEEPRR